MKIIQIFICYSPLALLSSLFFISLFNNLNKGSQRRTDNNFQAKLFKKVLQKTNRVAEGLTFL